MLDSKKKIWKIGLLGLWITLIAILGIIIKRMRLNKEKFKNALLYFAKYGGNNVGKKKLAKLLYFVDFTLYELREKSLTEINYVKMYYGLMPEPKTFYSELEELKTKGIIDIQSPTWADRLGKIIPKKDPKMEIFDEQEKEWLQKIAKQYRDKNAVDLERVMKSEPPYQMVEKDGEAVPYHLAFYRNTFGEMNLENEANSVALGGA